MLLYANDFLSSGTGTNFRFVGCTYGWVFVSKCWTRLVVDHVPWIIGTDIHLPFLRKGWLFPSLRIQPSPVGRQFFQECVFNAFPFQGCTLICCFSAFLGQLRTSIGSRGVYLRPWPAPQGKKSGEVHTLHIFRKKTSRALGVLMVRPTARALISLWMSAIGWTNSKLKLLPEIRRRRLPVELHTFTWNRQEKIPVIQRFNLIWDYL